MKVLNSLFLILLTGLLIVSQTSNAQSKPKDCPEIKVEVKTTDPAPGRKNGRIDLTFPDSSKKYKVFVLNAGSDRAKKQIDNGIIDNLQAGFFDLLIIDEKGCNKQLTIKLK